MQNGLICSKLKMICNERTIFSFRLFNISLLLILINFSLFVSHSNAQLVNGGLAESYLQRNVGGRAVSLAGSYTAVVNEPIGLFYNPAGLGMLPDRAMVSTSVSVLQFGRTQAVAAWGQTFGKVGVGFGINGFTSGPFTARDINGNSLGNVSAGQYALDLGAAYSMEFASVGLGIKYLSNTLRGSDVSGQGYSIDLGTKFNVMNLFSFGLAMQNITGKMFWNTESNHTDMLPFVLRTGVAMEFGLNESVNEKRSEITGEIEKVNIPASRYIMVSLDGTLTQNEQNPTITVGIEAVPHELFAIRGGIAIMGENNSKFELFPMTVWGGGVSLRAPVDALPFTTHLDYSISNDLIASNGICHHISLVFQF